MRELATAKSAAVKAFSRKYVGSQSFLSAAACAEGAARAGSGRKNLEAGKAGGASNLVAFPAMSNFCGYRFPLEWIDVIKREYSGNFVLLDAASHVSSASLDLSVHKPDFVCVSFYKMFGYPTGLGALLVRQISLRALEGKRYFGGGTVEMNLVRQRVHAFKRRSEEPADWLEDGTLPFLDIAAALDHGFDAIGRLPLGIEGISRHCHHLARYFFDKLRSLRHRNGRPAATIYSSTDYSDRERQGPVVNFNLLKEDGNCYGCAAFRRLAETRRIALRTGCFCNVGACQRYLGISDEDVLRNYRVRLATRSRSACACLWPPACGSASVHACTIHNAGKSKMFSKCFQLDKFQCRFKHWFKPGY